jgi:hypothetical protein
MEPSMQKRTLLHFGLKQQTLIKTGLNPKNIKDWMKWEATNGI